MRRFFLTASAAAIAMLAFAPVVEAAPAHHKPAQHKAQMHHAAAKKKASAKKGAKSTKKTHKAEASPSAAG